MRSMTFAFLFLVGLASASRAAENNEGKQVDALTATQLGNYSLQLDTDQPRNVNPPDPTGLTPLRQETKRPFVGLKLSRPLPDSFWNFMH